ncbi:hypothetical protein DICPUDRAFT_47551 [Dictyostelium purpureum]|uniref:PA14 domain-containing protein n=1 Tax=Dictyostelium purpureum TaxID=5786 RepID=F0ZK08_DICPU|nr:uncharacterized protein DICPUDRAFT_47551 [Dictyostelium purpureum]EGC35696.1 hypothetical protein DICPUDRAFT_47551 [Dictyostelium purpureum]|eukprot:XP_003287752.1 hypothetical protein DICPUDRAFT_47551 [Dictyostelium purpureum]
MRSALLFLLLLCSFGFIKCQDTLVLSATIYDQSPLRNPDFEIPNAPNAVVQDIVLQNLGSDQTPVYCCGDTPVTFGNQIVVHNSTTFASWFHLIDGVSYAIPYSLTLVKGDDDLYRYQSSSFFPIDGLGFANQTLFPGEPTYNGHNYHFCMKIHYGFTYHGGEYFTFAGDDDVWVFFNNVLRIDIGGLHTSASRSVYVDDLGLTVGETYPFDFFYCERHTWESNLNIITNLNFSCLYYDACGVCQGNNDTCCQVRQCDLINHCLEPVCGEETNFECQYNAVTCDDNDACTSDSCDVGFGCLNFPVQCWDGNHCTEDYCDGARGCVHTPIANCSDCPLTGCISNDACVLMECDPTNSTNCISRAINCSNSDPCIDSFCLDGECVYEYTCNVTVSPSDTPSHLPISTPSIEPTPTPTGTPIPEPPTYPPAYPAPKDLPLHCLRCEDLNCDSEFLRCTYIKNESFESDENCSDCCSWTPTCY